MQTPIVKIKIMAGFFLSMLLASILEFVPLPHLIEPFNPSWYLIAIVTWASLYPEYIGVGLFFFAGIFMDIVSDSVMGMNALIFIIIFLFLHKVYKDIFISNIYRRVVLWGVVTFIFLSMKFILSRLFTEVDINLTFWFPLFSNVIIWPIVTILIYSFGVSLGDKYEE